MDGDRKQVIQEILNTFFNDIPVWLINKFNPLFNKIVQAQ